MQCDSITVDKGALGLVSGDVAILRLYTYPKHEGEQEVLSNSIEGFEGEPLHFLKPVV
jgi:hypothetical protein